MNPDSNTENPDKNTETTGKESEAGEGQNAGKENNPGQGNTGGGKGKGRKRVSKTEPGGAPATGVDLEALLAEARSQLGVASEGSVGVTD